MSFVKKWSFDVINFTICLKYIASYSSVSGSFFLNFNILRKYQVCMIVKVCAQYWVQPVTTVSINARSARSFSCCRSRACSSNSTNNTENKRAPEVAGAAPWFTCSLNRCVARPYMYIYYLWKSVQLQRASDPSERSIMRAGGIRKWAAKHKAEILSLNTFIIYNPAAALGDTHHSPITVPACIMTLPRVRLRTWPVAATEAASEKRPSAQRSGAHDPICIPSHTHIATRFSLFFVLCVRWLLALRHFLSPAFALSLPLMGNFKGCTCERRTPVARF